MTTQNPVSPPLAVAPPATARSALLRQIWKHRLEYLFISPFFIIFAIFHGYPLVWSVWLSFQRWQGIGEPRWFGLGNYERLLNNDRIWNAFGNTIIFLLLLLPIGITLNLVLASILNSPKTVGRNIFRVLFFLPYITSAVIVAIIFNMLLQDNFGWVNGILEVLGFQRVGWLTEPWPARFSVIMMVLWGGTGYGVLIMLGGLQGIPSELYDAASVDGAGILQKFFYITIPMMRNVLLFVSVTSTIGLLNLFSQPWLLFGGQGGPDQSVQTLNMIQYSTAFQSARYGEAAALGFIIAVIVLIVAVIQLRISRNREA